MGIKENKALRAVIGTTVMVWKISWRWGDVSGKAGVFESFWLTIMHL